MEYSSVFHLLVNELGKAKIPFVLIGGFAVNYYKVAAPVTPSVEILMTEENFEKALPLFEQTGYRKLIEENIFTRLRSDELDTFLDIDVVFVNSQGFREILADAREIEIQGMKLKIPSLRRLLALKFDLPSPRSLSMDQYVKFVAFFRKYVIKREVYEKQWRESIVDVRFSLK